MRYQERIYIQNDNHSVRNKDILNVNMSSDLSIFQQPKFDLSGATKVQCESAILAITIPSLDYIISSYSSCFGVGKNDPSCYSEVDWGLNIYANTILVYSGDVTTITSYSGHPTTAQFNSSLNIGLNNLGYTYTQTNGTFIIDKPYGINDITVKASLKYPLTGSCSGGCNGFSLLIGHAIFPSIDNSSQGVYIVDNMNTTIPVTFNFTANTDTFTANSTTFNYKIYKYSPDINLFIIPPVYESQDFGYSSLNILNELTVLIPLSGLSLDGDYLIKGYFKTDVSTDILGRLGKVLNTSDYINGPNFQLYDPTLDFYFVAITRADIPQFSQSIISGNSVNTNLALYQQVFLVDTNTPNISTDFYTRTGTTLTLSNTYVGDIIVTLNGLVLSKNVDYTLNGQVLTFIGLIYLGDIITIIYTRNSNQTLIGDTILLNTSISSGTTNSQGSNKYYFNTSSGKYEIYTTGTPVANSNIVVILNGIVLVKNIDYYQSTSNKNRIILEGRIQIGDIITIVYYPQANIVNGISNNSNQINWSIPNQQNLANGIFYLQYSLDNTFSTFSVSDVVLYQPYVTSYSGNLSLSGSVGTTWYYRVENKKEYVSICGDLIESVAYSEIIPVVIQSNAINSY